VSQTEAMDPRERRQALLTDLRAAGWVVSKRPASRPLLLHELEAIAAAVRASQPWTACEGSVIRRDGRRHPAWRNHYLDREEPRYLVEASAAHEPFRLVEATPAEIATFREAPPL
jgi:hypothetical protein